MSEPASAETTIPSLQACCDHAACALVVVGPDSTAVQALTREVDQPRQQLVLDIVGEPPELNEDTPAPCSIVVSARPRPLLFVTETVSVAKPAGDDLYGKLVVRLPRFVNPTDRRQTFRIPIVDDNLVRLQVWYGDPKRRLVCRGLDISSAGIGVELAEPDAELEVGLSCEVRARCGDHLLKQDAQLSWWSDQQCGFRFPDPANPSQELWAIVKRVEQLFVRGR